MADTKTPDKADTIVLPPREVIARPLGDSPVFKEMWEEKRGPVKSLGEAGLTKVVIVYQDKKGAMRSKTVLVSHDTCDMVIGLLEDEQLG